MLNKIITATTLRRLSTSTPTTSKLHSKYSFTPPPTLNPTPKPEPTQKPIKQPYKPPSSLTKRKAPLRSNLPFDFRFSYTESSPNSRPIGLREPKYSPFGPNRVDRAWTGVCAPAVDLNNVGCGESEVEMAENGRVMRERVQGEKLGGAERKEIVERCQRHNTKSQINLGRDGLTHNMLNDIHNSWKNVEAVRIKCMGVPTVDMKNICTQLEEKSFGKIIFRHGGQIILYRGRRYTEMKRPVIPLMLWKPREPVYPKLVKTTIDGLSIVETKEMRKIGLSVPALTKLAKNGYYGNLVRMIQDAFLVDELVRIDCKGLPKSDYKKIGCKLRDLVPCILVTFEKEQIVIWRGNDYKPAEDCYFLNERELFDDSDEEVSNSADRNEKANETQGQQDYYSGESDGE